MTRSDKGDDRAARTSRPERQGSARRAGQVGKAARNRWIVAVAAVSLAVTASAIWFLGNGGSEGRAEAPIAEAEVSDNHTSRASPSDDLPPVEPDARYSARREPAREPRVGRLGEPITARGLAVTVTEAVIEEGRDGREHLVVYATLVNDSDEPQPYTRAAFSLIAAGGPVLRPLPPDRGDAIELATLEPGEQVSGTVTFDAGDGTHTLTFGPSEPLDQYDITWAIEV